MPTYEFPFAKIKPAFGGSRQDYITPGMYQFKVVKYSDDDSSTGKVMHAFTSQIVRPVGKGAVDQKGKKIIDHFAMPKSAKDSMYPVERLLAFFLSAGAKIPPGKSFKADPNRMVGKTFIAEVFDQQQEERKVGDRTYPKRTVSALGYPDPVELKRATRDDEDEDEDEDEDVEDEDNLDDDEEDEDEDDEEDDEEDEDEDDEEDDDDDEEEEEDDDDDEEEEEEEPAPASRRRAAATSSRNGTRTAREPAAAAPRRSRRAAADDDSFPFD